MGKANTMTNAPNDVSGGWLEWLCAHSTMSDATEDLCRLVYSLVPIVPQTGSNQTFAHWLKAIKASNVLKPDELETLRYEVNQCLW